MSEPLGHMPDRDGLAAEYVLGTLPLPDRAEAERLIGSDPAFAALVAVWQDRMAPLNGGYAEATPPEAVWERLEARLFPAPPRRQRSRWPLFGTIAVALAALAFIAYWPQTEPPGAVVATLTAENQPLVVAARFDPAAGVLTFTRSAGPEAETGRDYELWVIPAGGAAVSLGLLRGAELAVPVKALPAGTTLAVTLEPEGGSPTGVATGPIVVATVVGGA